MRWTRLGWAALAAGAVGGWLGSAPRPETLEDERHVARTADGWNLALYRYRPRGQPYPWPVVCGHGLAGTRLLFDLGPEVSFAKALADAGFDTWLVDLRGRGASWPAGGYAADLQWDFDDLVWRDLPAAVARVCEVAGATGVFWLGQEMSGQAGYAAAVARTVPELRGLVTLGAPALTPQEASVPGVTAPPRVEINGRVPYRSASSVAGPVLARLAPPTLADAFAGGQTPTRLVARYLRYGVADEAVPLVDQLREWLSTGTFASRDGVDFAARLDQVDVPTLLLVGAADRQRPPSAVADTHRRLGPGDRTFATIGREQGYDHDYGHDDLVASRSTGREVIPLIAGWLAKRQP